MDIGEPVKFRVTGETFEESSPVGPPANDAATAAAAVQNAAAHSAANQTTGSGSGSVSGTGGNAGGVGAGVGETVKTPYRIVVAINESGLGLLSWWDQHNQATDEEADDDAGEEYEE